jgi:hypothetical protein
VSGNGAYGSEMNEVALFESALHAAVPTQPDPMLGARLVPRLAEVARSSTIEGESAATRRRPRSRPALVARVGVAIALVPLVLAGLAFAGVTVPGAARSAFKTVGVPLPNQPSSHDHGSAAGQSSGQPTTNNDTETATSTSQSKGNSAAAHQHALKQRDKAHGKAIGHSRGNAIGLNGATPPGHAKEPGPPSHSNAGGASGTHPSPHATSKPHPTHTPHGNANGHSK